MKFLKVEWTKKRGAIALLATSLVVTSFILGGYISTGNLNPWGNRHYYQILNANFQECHTLSGVQACTSEHNVLYNAGALWVQQVTSGETPTGGVCAPSATCGFKYIAMSAGTTAPAARHWTGRKRVSRTRLTKASAETPMFQSPSNRHHPILCLRYQPQVRHL